MFKKKLKIIFLNQFIMAANSPSQNPAPAESQSFSKNIKC